MKVQALINYHDKELKKYIKAGEELEVTEKRAEVLLKGNASSGDKPFVKVVEENEPEVIEEPVVEETVVEEVVVEEEPKKGKKTKAEDIKEE